MGMLVGSYIPLRRQFNSEVNHLVLQKNILYNLISHFIQKVKDLLQVLAIIAPKYTGE